MSKPLKVKKVSPGDSMQRVTGRILRTRLKEFYSHWPDPQQQPTPVQLHNLRISGKRLRYSAEQLRDLYSDRLALLIDLLKRSQDLLGEIQDCVTQRGVIEVEIAKLQLRNPAQASLLQPLMAEYAERQQTLFAQFREIWMGMALPELRASLKAMVALRSANNSQNDEGKAFSSGPVSE